MRTTTMGMTLLIILTWLPMVWADSRPLLTRSEVVFSIKANVKIQFNGNGGKGHDTAAMEDVAKCVDQLAPEVLPLQISGSTVDVLKLATTVPLVISYCDEEYIRAAVKLHLLAIPLMVSYLDAFPPLTANQHAAVRASLEKFRSGVAAKMVAALVPLGVPGLDEAAIDRATNLSISDLNRFSGSSLSYVLMVPLDDAEIDSLISDFDTRLRDNEQAITDRIIVGVRRSGHNPSAVVDRVLAEVLAGARKSVLERTVDVRRKAFADAEMSSPEWERAESAYAKAVDDSTRAHTPALSPSTQLFK